MQAKYCKVLIVDDEFIIRQGIEYMINWEKEGFEIVGEAANGEDALAKIEEFHPHIVVTDIVMPKMDGMELTKRIREHHPEIRVIILSSYSEFDYVRNTFQYGAIDYILKPTLSPDGILKTLKSAAAQIEGLTLHNQEYDNITVPLTQYILGYLDTLPLDNIKQYFVYSNYVMLMTNINYHKNKDKIKNLFKVELENIDGFHAGNLRVNEEVLLCIYSYKENEYDDLLLKLKDILKGKELFLLSEPFYDIHDIKSMYLEQVVPELKKRFYLKGKSLVLLNNKVEENNMKRFDNRKFSGLLSSVHLNEALDMFYEYIQDALKYHVDEFEIKSFTNNKLYNFISVLEERNFNEKSIRYFKLNCLSRLESAVFADDFQKEIKQVYDDFKVIIKKYEIESDHAVMNKIMKYVYDHYDEPLTLNDLATKFSFSYQYLSSYFSNRNDNTFIEYLNNIRIEKASELLQQSKMAIADIGIKVGYSDHSYFCKVFKKYKGMTPSEYRKR